MVAVAGAVRPGPGGAGTEEGPGLVEQGGIGLRPDDGVHVRGAGAVERRQLVVAQPLRPGQLQQRLRAEQVVEELGRREQRPHPLERDAHLLGVARAVADLVDRELLARRARQGGEQLALDEAAAGVVTAVAATGRLHDPLALGHRDPQVREAEGHDERLPQGRSRSCTALASTSAMRASPFTLAASG